MLKIKFTTDFCHKKSLFMLKHIHCAGKKNPVLYQTGFYPETLF